MKAKLPEIIKKYKNPIIQEPIEIEGGLEFKGTKNNLGKIPALKIYSLNVTVKNNNNVSVTLNNVVSSCGCIMLEYEKNKKIAPGETYIVKINFRSGGLGTFKKDAKLEFDNGIIKTVLRGETDVR